MKEFVPRVIFRRSQQLVWHDVTALLPLFHYDAVQTLSGASALLVLNGGSELEMGGDSLVIIDPVSLAHKHRRDRALVRAGKIRGSTTDELWLLTAAALIQMKAKEGESRARLTVAVRDGRKLNVELEEGRASLVTSKNTLVKREPTASDKNTLPVISPHTPPPAATPTSNSMGLEKVELTPAHPLSLEIPLPSVDETELLPEAEVEAVLSSPSATPTPSLTPTPGPPSPSPSATASPAVTSKPRAARRPPRPPVQRAIGIIIERPANYSRASTADIELAGRVTGHGGRITINGNETPIGADLRFSAKIPLQSGVNTILIQLLQPDGESAFRQWVVIRE